MRRLLFAGLLAPLVAVALLLGPHRANTSPPQSPVTTPVAVRRPPPGSAPRDDGPQVRRFLSAFLSYEIGEDGPPVVAAIEASASRHFARQLLSAPPPPAGRPPRARARISSLHIDPVPGHPDLALVTGDAHRREGPEPFSFLFARHAGRWLAVAPGE